MKKNFVPGLPALLLIIFFASCKKEVNTTSTNAKLIFKFKFDSTQVRLNNIGQPQGVAPGNAGQSPVFNKMSAHYIELAPTAVTALGAGAILYHAPETTIGGSTAIDFEKAIFAGNNETFYSIPLKNVTPGEY
ncbi:MAG: hypothetical protein H7Y01_12845, partial [Ferruginibacter sp.]|nr:hypothetical protein [Chitinophagaceae bacterium]